MAPATEYCLFFVSTWMTCMQKSEWAAWMQAIFSVAAIVAAYLIARWQSDKDRRLQREREIAAAEVAGSFVADLTIRIHAVLLDLQQGLARRNQGLGFDVTEHRRKLIALVFPSETQMFALAPVVNAGAISLARGINITRQLEHGLTHVASLNGEMEMVFRDMMLQNMEPLVTLGIEHMSTANAAFIDLLGHKVPPVGRHVIDRG